MDVGVAAARVIRSRHRIAASFDILDRVAKLLNAADDRTLRRREDHYRVARLIAKRRVERAARTHLHQLHRRTDGIRLGLH